MCIGQECSSLNVKQQHQTIKKNEQEVKIKSLNTWLMAPSVFIVDAFGCRLRNTVTESQSDIFSKIFLPFFSKIKIEY